MEMELVEHWLDMEVMMTAMTNVETPLQGALTLKALYQAFMNGIMYTTGELQYRYPKF